MNQHIYSHRNLYIDKTGKVVIDASRYEKVRSFSGGLAAVYRSGRGWGFINQTGTVVIEPRFQNVLDFSEGVAGVQVADKWGFMDEEGRVVIQPAYESVNPFSEGVAVVVKDASATASRPSSTGKAAQGEASRSELITLSDSFNGRHPDEQCARDGSAEILLIDKSGRTILSLSQYMIEPGDIENAGFSDGLMNVYDCSKSKYGYIDKVGKFIIEPRYDQAAPFSEGVAKVATGSEGSEEKIGFIGRGGRFVIPPKFNTDGDFQRNSTNFSEGLASLTEGLQPTFTKEAKFVYIDKAGAVVLLTDFFYAGPFRSGIASVYDEEKNKWGFIDRTGRVVIPLQYDLVEGFSEGLAHVTVAGSQM
ncbi:MAG TPA: WG repeat-containing protein [Pyrinomonadaceae bacterium]|jgi:hypothetical protein|nr:WG repeat-containing protein [Pyrinomonadaceae bacterium]